MHGQTHKKNGILLLQDLEDDDDDSEFQTSYSPNNFLNTSTTTTNFLQVPKFHADEDLRIPRRKSVSAEVSTTNSNGISTFPHTISLSLSRLPFENEGTSTNGITLAPSRTSLLEPNVFSSGRASPNNNHLINVKKNARRKHKARCRSPLPLTSTPSDPSSILDRIDNSILRKFGDWDEKEDPRGVSLPLNKRSNKNNVPYYIPKKQMSLEEDISSSVSAPLPRLFKNYETIVTNTNGFLSSDANSKWNANDANKIRKSRDNDDPNSILSQAKRTLSRFSQMSD